MHWIAASSSLNGGLGTSMGMQGPKSLLTVKGRPFLFRHMRAPTAAPAPRHRRALPLVLMNKLHDARTRYAPAEYPEFTQDVPSDFLQQ